MTSFQHLVRPWKDFPKSGVTYWDIASLLQDPAAFREATLGMAEFCRGLRATKVAAIEAKGFLLAAPVALELALPLLLVRKPGLTPGGVRKLSFEKEYGEGHYEIREDAVKSGDRVVVVYDILATAGAGNAARSLVSDSGGEVVGFCFAIELLYLEGRKDLGEAPIFSLVSVGDR